MDWVSFAWGAGSLVGVIVAGYVLWVVWIADHLKEVRDAGGRQKWREAMRIIKSLQDGSLLLECGDEDAFVAKLIEFIDPENDYARALREVAGRMLALRSVSRKLVNPFRTVSAFLRGESVEATALGLACAQLRCGGSWSLLVHRRGASFPIGALPGVNEIVTLSNEERNAAENLAHQAGMRVAGMKDRVFFAAYHAAEQAESSRLTALVVAAA